MAHDDPRRIVFESDQVEVNVQSRDVEVDYSPYTGRLKMYVNGRGILTVDGIDPARFKYKEWKDEVKPGAKAAKPLNKSR